MLARSVGTTAAREHYTARSKLPEQLAQGGDQRSTQQLEHEQTKQRGHNGLLQRTTFWRRYCYFLRGGRKFTLISDREHALNSATQSEHSQWIILMSK